jgi:hypothetical protein
LKFHAIPLPWRKGLGEGKHSTLQRNLCYATLGGCRKTPVLPAPAQELMPKHSDSAALAALKIAAHVCRERIARPKVTRLGEVPYSIAAITPAWLTEVLCKDCPGARVTEVRIEHSSTGTHARHRLFLTYNEEGQKAGLPRSVFSKTLPTLFNRMMGGYNGTARAEGRFYAEIRPRLEDIEAPVGYHWAFDRRTFAAVNLMEDLVATKKATFCNYRTPVSRGTIEDMIDQLASLHGCFYGDPRLDTEFRWLSGYGAWFKIGSQKMKTAYYTDKSFTAAAHVIPRDLLARRDEVWPAVMRAAEVHDARPKSVLHSDVHIGNWYRTGAGKMGLCDWQTLCKGHWSRDFSYAVTSALETEDRRRWERELLLRYLERLRERTGIRFDFDDAWTLYRRQIFHALWMWTITLCHSPLLPSMQPKEACLTMIRRITTALSDLECLDSF